MLAAAVLAATGVGLRQLETPAPSVARAAVWVDTVRRGPLVREVFGQGRLAAVDVRWLTARHAAEVSRVLAAPGSAVQADTVLLVLHDTEVELTALEAERELTRARAEHVELGEQTRASALAQQSAIATLEGALGEAARRARADEQLAQKGFLSALEVGQARAAEQELSGRLAFERQRLEALARGNSARLRAQKAHLEQLGAVAAARRAALEALSVRATLVGVLAELPLEQGQFVSPGTLLAKVMRTDHLQAELRIPESLAGDLRVGQRASIDTRSRSAAGKVTRIDPGVQAGTVRVDVAFEEPLPPGARPDLNIEGVIELERLDDVLFIKRPAGGVPGTTASLFRLTADGEHADRVSLRLGRASRELVEVTEGLREGDRVIVSDLPEWADAARIRLR